MATNENPTPQVEATPAPVEEMTGAEYIAAIEKMRSEMVPREMYDKLRTDHRNVINAYASGNYQNPNETTPPPTIGEMCEKLYSKASLAKIGNCEFAKTALELRTRLIESGAKDPFTSPEVAELLEYCLESANGNDKVFAAELEGHLEDDIAALASQKSVKASRKW